MDDMDEQISISMRRKGSDGTSHVKTCSRLKYDYSIDDYLREYDEHSRETIEDVADQLACMSPSDLQSMIDRMGCEQHLQLQKLLNAWDCEYSSNHPELENEEGEDYGF
ncbi:hypothetical protein CMI47_04085 [Candidatus Pacearchaeota archaeon]|jgi:hypothetical protein|nr:hypothetical protein [Candidatus Pacearchaeota archaeon]|tara:strand:+ start:314 stop:640 length:327 start_codon:yes stop_codon:yes gene_type:complete